MPRSSRTARPSPPASRSSASTCSPRSAAGRSRYAFWRRFAEIPAVVAIKIAPFNRYQTLDVVRAVVDAGRDDIALYTGNDDAIVSDLVTPFRFVSERAPVERRIVGRPAGALGRLDARRRGAARRVSRRRARIGGAGGACCGEASRSPTPTRRSSTPRTASPAASPGIQEVLRRQGLLASVRCLDPHEVLSTGQAAEIDRVCRAYPHLADDEFVAANLAEWMS